MADYKTPGVYIEEISKLPPSIASVETAIPAFIGYTEKATWKVEGDLTNRPWRIKSLLEYEQYFGFPDPEKDSLTVTFENGKVNAAIDETKRSKFLMYYSLQMFFANGGGPCWIVAVNKYGEAGVQLTELSGGLKETAKINEVTLLLFPDAMNLTTETDYYNLHDLAIQQCVDLQDRFVIMDIFHKAENGKVWDLDVKLLRDTIGTTENLKYAAVYFPRIYTGIDYNYKIPGSLEDQDESIVIVGIAGKENLKDLKSGKNAEYFQAKNALSNLPMLLPTSSAMAGIYAQVDNSRGVWKAPANININSAIEPEFLLSKLDQGDLNVDAQSGKSINVIRKFEGRGPAIVWGARTLNGNSNEWRYIPVRRFFIMVEESVKNATEQFVFEPNDENTWIRVKSMIQNYLTTQWRAGALMGASVKEAYFVHVGLGETMTELDVWEGRMIIEIGMAVVRPAEFIILRFMHKMLEDA
jgi:phage tail sheath protein FI